MKFISLSLALATAGFSASSHAAQTDYSVVSLGVESINYQEKLDSFVNTDGFSTDTTVTNPMHRAKSYTVIDKDWGFYIGTASTLMQNSTTEDWDFNGIGKVQTNEFRVNVAELELKGAYNLSENSQLIFGGSFFSLHFTRSEFRRAAQADALDAKLKEADPLNSFVVNPGSVSESIDNVELMIGYLIDSEFGQSADFNWYVGVEAALPVYYRVTNSSTDNIELDKTLGGGYAINGYTGVRWKVSKRMSADIGVRAQYKIRDSITGDYTDRDGESRTSTLPDVTYSALQAFVGINWRY